MSGDRLSTAILEMESPVCAVETCMRLLQDAISRRRTDGIIYLADSLEREIGDLRKVFDSAVEAVQSKEGDSQ